MRFIGIITSFFWLHLCAAAVGDVLADNLQPGEKLKMARCKALGGSQPKSSRDYTFLADISYGHYGKCIFGAFFGGYGLMPCDLRTAGKFDPSILGDFLSDKLADCL